MDVEMDGEVGMFWLTEQLLMVEYMLIVNSDIVDLHYKTNIFMCKTGYELEP